MYRYIGINRAYSKDFYQLPHIDILVDNSIGYKHISFIDAYSSYYKILMFGPDRKKAVFMTKANYQYNVMSIGTKNMGAMCQRMMNKIFLYNIGEVL